MVKKFISYISILVCTFLLFGCYCGVVTPGSINWSVLEPSETLGELEVTVLTESGNNLAYQGENLLISINQAKITENVSIELADDTNIITTLVDDFSGPFPFSWIIPEDFLPGESYRIVVKDQYYIKDSGIFGCSPEFAILTNFVSGLSDITVSSRSIDITLTDNGSVIDDDTISIILNGSVLEANHVLLGPPGTKMTLDLQRGTNTLSITAVNEGSVSPNTAEISFTDVLSGEEVQQWRLAEGETGTLSIQAP